MSYKLFCYGATLEEQPCLTDALKAADRFLHEEYPVGKTVLIHHEGELIACISSRAIDALVRDPRSGTTVTVDVTREVLALELEQLLALDDGQEFGQRVVAPHVGPVEPQAVRLMQSIREHFGLDDLTNLTPQAHLIAKARAPVASKWVVSARLAMNVVATAETPYMLKRFLEDPQLRVTTDVPGVVLSEVRVTRHSATLP